VLTPGIKQAPDITSFYVAFAPLCFTLLGLWLIVVQTRHQEWRRSPAHRTRAYALSLNFALPGTMALLALIDPANHTIWRVSFATIAFGALGALGWLTTRGPGRAGTRLLVLVTGALVGLLYLVIAIVALSPKVVKDVGVHLMPLEVEEILLSILVLIAVNVAWFLMFEEAELPSPAPDASDSA
jgi:hypothetical protein